jgi:hypothetical protein
VRFVERREFIYDTEVFKLRDTQTALRIHHEYVVRCSAIPRPRFFEVDRSDGSLDELWHVPVSPRTTFSREFDIPAINKFMRPRWQITPVGMTPQRQDSFWLSNVQLSLIDYFPTRGDMVFWSGYRYMILNVVLPPEAYWLQTGVWLGLSCECIIPPEGDAPPIIDVSHTVPSERSTSPAIKAISVDPRTTDPGGFNPKDLPFPEL